MSDRRFGDAFLDARLRRGWTMGNVARALGRDAEFVSRVELGEVQLTRAAAVTWAAVVGDPSIAELVPDLVMCPDCRGACGVYHRDVGVMGTFAPCLMCGGKGSVVKA